MKLPRLIVAEMVHGGVRRVGPLAIGFLLLSTSFAAAEGFDQWLGKLKGEARSQGISEETIKLTLDGLEPDKLVIKLQRKQPERTYSLEEYLRRVVPTSRISKGRELLALHSELLERVADSYGVQPRFIVALWGVESDFGRNTGDFSTLRSLATIAHGGRNGSYFRRELLLALKLVDKGFVNQQDLVGSWAGAMGQCQFMPSSFTDHATDFDGDGRRDIWSTHADIFASAARYLSRSGWHGDQTWGREVRLPPDFDIRLAEPGVRMRLSRWQALGVRRADGRDLPDRDLWSTIILPDTPGGRAFVVYDNFQILLKWNRSTHFALSVGYLADRLGK